MATDGGRCHRFTGDFTCEEAFSEFSARLLEVWYGGSSMDSIQSQCFWVLARMIRSGDFYINLDHDYDLYFPTST